MYFYIRDDDTSYFTDPDGSTAGVCRDIVLFWEVSHDPKKDTEW